MASEIAQGQLCQSFAAIEIYCVWRPLIKQDKRWLFAFARAKTNDAVLRKSPQNMKATLSSRRDMNRCEQRVQGVPCQLLTPLQGLDDRSLTTLNGDTVDFKLPLAARATSNNARCQKLEHPAHVRRRHKVQCAAHRPGADDQTVGNRLLDFRSRGFRQAKADRPERAGIVLSLHSAKRGHYLARCFASGISTILAD